MSKAVRFTAAVALATCAFAASAHGPVKCDAIPQAEWQPQMTLQDKLRSEGWKVRQVKVWNGCYEVYGTDAKGERVEAFFNPKTFDRVQEGPEEKK